jgi:hypothetical protein
MPSLAHRVARSLLFDLLLPWTVSAVLVMFFFILSLSIGVIGWLLIWPPCVLLFIVLCNARRDAREHAELVAADAGLDEAALLAKYGIHRDNERYEYEHAAYAALSEVIASARHRYLQKRRSAWPRVPPEAATPPAHG